MRKNTLEVGRRSPGRSRKLKVGDSVRFRFAARDVEGRIIEDRGAIAIGGQQLYRVLFDLGGIDKEIELPSDELQIVTSK